MAQVTVLAPGTYPPGSRLIGPRSVPTNLSFASLALDVTNNTSPAQGISIAIELSFDGGANWSPFVAMSRAGESPNAFPTMAWSGGVPQDGNPNRQVRATLTLTGSSITTAGMTLETS